MESRLTEPAAENLMDCYILSRPQLIRFFTARTQSRQTAEDIVQDIAIRLQGLPATVNSGVEAPLPFIYRIGVNLMLDRVKQAQRTRIRDENWTRTQVSDLNGLSVTDDPDPEKTASARQQLAQVRAIMGRLGPQCRRAFQLHKFDGLTHADVAAQMGISRSAVEKHISTALKVLLREMRQNAAK